MWGIEFYDAAEKPRRLSRLPRIKSEDDPSQDEQSTDSKNKQEEMEEDTHVPETNSGPEPSDGSSSVSTEASPPLDMPADQQEEAQPRTDDQTGVASRTEDRDQGKS